MKLNYHHQLILSVVLVLLGNILCSIFKHWIYRNIALFLCGMLWIIHPVLAIDRAPTEKELRLVRFWGGGILLLIAFFTRSYIY